MKNIGILVFGFILGALVMYYLNSTSTTPKVLAEAELVKPKGLITPSEAKILDKAYNERYAIISDSLFKDSNGDNRSSWFALEELTSYIDYAKNQAKDNGFRMDGLRIYLGAYPDNKEGTGLTTMFFIPTGYKSTSKGSFFTLPQGSGDLTGSDGLNFGSSGNPPGANYPQ